MKKILGVLGVLCLIGIYAHAIQVNPMSNVLADSANTAQTIAYRDTNGDFVVGIVTATTVNATSGVRISSAATAVVLMNFVGAYSDSELATKTAALGQIVFNTTLYAVCAASGTTGGAWVLPRSTSTTSALVICHN